MVYTLTYTDLRVLKTYSTCHSACSFTLNHLQRINVQNFHKISFQKHLQLSASIINGVFIVTDIKTKQQSSEIF